MNRKINVNRSFIVSILFVFALMVILNMNTVFVADDFNNMFTMDNEKITNIFQVFSNQVKRYYNTNGRILAHTIGEIILIFNKNIINIVDSAGFCALMYLMYKFSTLNDFYGIDIGYKHNRKVIKKNKYGRHIYKTMFFLNVFFLVWKFTPVFGQDFLWIIGAANYMWTNVILLSALLIARKVAVLDYRVRSIKSMVFTIFISVLAGMTNENSVPALLTIYVYYIVKMMKEKHKELPTLILMFISSFAGFIVMITAPGNFVRMSFFKESEIMLVRYFNRLQRISEAFSEHFTVILIIVLIIALIARIIDLKKSFETEAYIVAALVSYFSMIMAPTFPPRAMVITLILFIISIVMNISVIGRFNINIAMGILSIGIVLGGVYFAKTYFEAVKDAGEYVSKYSAREIIIKDSKNMGRFENIRVPAVETDNPYCAAYGLGDCEEDKNNWINEAIARYYGVNSIILRKK